MFLRSVRMLHVPFGTVMTGQGIAFLKLKKHAFETEKISGIWGWRITLVRVL